MSTTPALPRLIDCAGIVRELGVKRNIAEAIMRDMPKVTIPGKRKVFVRRADVERRLEEWTQAA